MKTTHPKKVYHQTERALSTDSTRRSIIEAAIKLVRASRRVGDVTLNDIAEDAGVALRTVLRHFGSRDGVFEAAFAEIRERISGNRVPTTPGDVNAAVESLVHHYEQDGDLNIKALGEEGELPMLHRLLNIGRKFHSAWIEECFGPLLPPLSKARRQAKFTELYAATDVYLWKLLRRDLGQTRAATQSAILNLVQGCIAEAHKK